ncbi:DNA-directed RNA polymerase III subunit RPC9 [[Candida] anglica]|uniref:DNA-directed RNA polymerase III subunit RPC9 n=1 Tax=[Candida] anglica TaxID=148631 RepID=A0ABP0ELL3_9ASCO
MKILNPRDKFLSNYEVLSHLQDIKKKNNWTFGPEENDKKFQKKRFTACGLDLEVITRDLSSYLQSSPCGVIESDEQFSQLMLFLNTFELEKIEKLQIVNSLPRSMVCLYAVVEECDQRFDEDTCETIIAKINELFPVEGEDEEEGEEEEEAAMEQSEEPVDEEDNFEDAQDVQMEE